MNMRSFLAQVDAIIDDAVSNPIFHPLQKELLLRTVQRYRPLTEQNPIGDPTWRSTLYLIARAWGRSIDEQVLQAAAFCSLYLLAADLADDVQDNDLVGKAHEHIGPAIAINDAFALLLLAFERLRVTVELEPSPERKRAWLRVFNWASIRAVGGQHRDLLGAQGATSPNEVLEMVQARNSSLSMIMECAALLGRCTSEQTQKYRALGEKVTTFCQIREDLSDIFGKSESPDLGEGKMTYPVACFLQSASAAKRLELEELQAHLPGSLREIRTLFYESGAVQAAAVTMEQLREEIHALLASLDNRCAAHRCLLSLVDGIAESVYDPPAIECTRCYFEPEGHWHECVRGQLQLFVERMSEFGVPGQPQLRPWHLPLWMYEPLRNTIFYPDLEEMSDEILPEQATLLKLDDLEVVRKVQWRQVPTLMAHEMFHYWRNASGRITRDFWHEEWVANKLAVAYAGRFEPEALASSIALAEHVAKEYGDQRAADFREILSRCPVVTADVVEGYAMPTDSMLALTMAMIRKLVADQPDLPMTLSELVSPSELTSADAAA